MKVKIALVQTVGSTTTSAKEDNLCKAIKFIEEAATNRAQIVIFPEVFMGGSPEDVNGPFVSSIASKARELGIYVVVGIREKNPLIEKYYNTVVFIDSKGFTIGIHRKIQLYDAFDFKESNNAIAGDKITAPFNTEFGKISIITCYEIRFPEIARILTLMGTDILLVPSAWKKGPLKEEHWLTLVKARALENTIFIAAVGQTGNTYIGRSIVVDPFGIVITDAGEEEKLLVVEIDLERIKNVRKILPVLEQRRDELYKNII